MQIVIAGNSGFAREVSGWLTQRRIAVRKCIFDDEEKKLSMEDYVPQPTDEFVIAIADPKGRESVATRLSKMAGVKFHNLHLMTANVNVVCGLGNVWCPTSLVSAGTRVGDFVQVNVMTSIGHDVRVGNFCTFSSHVDICGWVEIGDRCFFGSGSRVFPKVKIGNDVTVGAGAIVMNDLPDGTTVYAQPARTLK